MESTILRKAGLNEKRCIIRHNLGLYTNLIVGAVYSIPRNLAEEHNLQELALYRPALIECIRQHPFLSATILDPAANEPVFTQPKQLDLQNHFRVIRHDELLPKTQFAAADETSLLVQVIEQLHNDPRFSFHQVDSVPAWALDLLLLNTSSDAPHYRIFISLTYSHSHGDGMSGIAFHRTFLKALQQSLPHDQSLAETIVDTSPLPLPNQPDTPSKMPISWSYLLRALLGSLLPKSMSRLLGIPSSLSGADENTWTGSPTFVDSRTSGIKATTGAVCATVSEQTLERLLAVCRNRGGRLSSLLNHLIAHVMKGALISARVRLDQNTNFISTTPVNLRRPLGVANTTIGNYASTAYARHDLSSITAEMNESSWQSIRSHDLDLAHVASTRHDQPIALLRYVPDFSAWMQGQIGKQRDSSWELSNLGSFDPENVVSRSNESLHSITIEQMIFSQPASPIGHPLAFNVVSVKGGGMTICITWQNGSLDLPSNQTIEKDDEVERRFVERVARSLCEKLEELE